ncbi:hypothetical protein ACQ4PT_011280 [Festuca glaucescens]
MRNQRLVPSTTSSSSKNNTKQEQPHLSGAYIRSLVKQLSSSSTVRSKDHHNTMGSKPHSQPNQEEGQQAAQATTPPQQQQPHKKQVRRRLHTSRPYQERLLNMAEARREIVSALKVHRASMRQAKEQQQLLQLQQQQEALAVQEQGQTSRVAACPPLSYASFSDYLYNSPFAHFTATSSSSYYSSPLPYQTPMVDAFDHLLPLPTQPLGLNLSFQGFDAVAPAGEDDAKNSTASFDPDLLLHHQPSPASSYSVYSSPSVTMVGHDMSSAVGAAADNASPLAADASLHRVLDEQEMAAIYSIGQQHDVEWSDTMNLVTSAWWSKLLESIEGGGEGTSKTESVGVEDTSSTATLDWFGGDTLGHQAAKGSGGSDVLGTMHLSEYYGEDVSLPRTDIGEIQGWDAEWFS